MSPEDAKKAIINTNVADFKDIVNIKNGNNFIDAGLDNTKLGADVDSNSGDIVLRAVASTVNSLDENFDKYEDSNNQAKASVTVDGTINARKDAVITAEATNGVKLADLFNNESVIEGDDNFIEAYGQITKNVATVDINGNVTGQHVNIEANTINNYISSTDEMHPMRFLRTRQLSMLIKALLLLQRLLLRKKKMPLISVRTAA